MVILSTQKLKTVTKQNYRVARPQSFGGFVPWLNVLGYTSLLTHAVTQNYLRAHAKNICSRLLEVVQVKKAWDTLSAHDRSTVGTLFSKEYTTNAGIITMQNAILVKGDRVRLKKMLTALMHWHSSEIEKKIILKYSQPNWNPTGNQRWTTPLENPSFFQRQPLLFQTSRGLTFSEIALVRNEMKNRRKLKI